MNWSSITVFVELKVVVVPLTVKLPATTMLSGKPIVNVSPDCDVSTSFAVPLTVSVSPKSIAVLPEPPATVIVEFASLAFAIEPANSSLLTPPFLIVTAPDDTAKLSELNDAIPFAEVDASEPAIVTVLLPSSTDVSIPVQLA